jgi:hypothetical protein
MSTEGPVPNSERTLLFGAFTNNLPPANSTRVC